MPRGGRGGSGGGTGPRVPGRGSQYPSHLISPDDVKDWLADSVNKRVTFHRTARLAAQEILERGVDLSKSRLGAYGQGFYTVTDPSGLPGDADLRVAVRLRHPLVGHADEMVRQVDDVLMQLYGRLVRLTMDVTQQVRKAFMEQGYDGMIIRDAGGDGVDYVVAFRAEAVRIVQG